MLILIKKIQNKKVLPIFILFVTGIYFFGVCIANLSIFTKPYNHRITERAYMQSQWQQSQNVAPDKVLDEWAIQNGYTGWQNYIDSEGAKINSDQKKKTILAAIQKKAISDALLYTYAGHQYVQGTNPSLINPEHPPLGKYFIGLSIRIFGNEHVILLLFGLFALILVYLLSFSFWKSHLRSSVIVLFISFHPLFVDQLIHGPQLELFQLTFFLLFLVFFSNALTSVDKLQILWAGISYGCLLATKTFFPFFSLFTLWIALTLLSTRIEKQKKYGMFFLIETIGISVFTLFYLPFFLDGGTLRSFLGLQKYIIVFYQHSGIPLFSYVGNMIPLIFSGNWKFWSGSSQFSHYNEWSVYWPLIFSVATVGFATCFSQKNNLKILSLLIFVGLYFFFCFFTPIFPRYLLLFFVPLILCIGPLIKKI